MYFPNYETQKLQSSALTSERWIY